MEAKALLLNERDDISLQSSQNIIKNSSSRSLRRDQILVLVGGVCIHLASFFVFDLFIFKVLGTFYLWGAISLYVASYLRSFDGTINIEMLSAVFPFAGLGLNIGLFFGLYIAEKIGYRLFVSIGIILTSVSVFCTSFITNYYGFVALYGIFAGICNGAIYIVPIVCGWKYFPNNKGLVSGITIGAFGFGAFVFNFIALAVVNPSNENPSIEYENYKYFASDVYSLVPKMFRVLSACYLGLGLIGAFLIRVPKVNKRVGDESITEKTQEIIASDDGSGCQSIMEGVKSKAFVSLFTIALFVLGLFMANNYKVYGITKIPDDDFITLVGSLGSVCNGSTRAVWALLFDKFGFKRIYFALITLQICLAPTISLISSYKALYLIWYCLIMSCEGGHFSLLPTVTAKVFGLNNWKRFGPKIYGYVFISFAITQFIGFFVGKYGLDTLGWNTIFLIALGFSIISFVVNIFFKEKFTRSK